MKCLISHVRLLFNLQTVHLFSNTFETAHCNMIIHVIVFLVSFVYLIASKITFLGIISIHFNRRQFCQGKNLLWSLCERSNPTSKEFWIFSKPYYLISPKLACYLQVSYLPSSQAILWHGRIFQGIFYIKYVTPVYKGWSQLCKKGISGFLHTHTLLTTWTYCLWKYHGSYKKCVEGKHTINVKTQLLAVIKWLGWNLGKVLGKLPFHLELRKSFWPRHQPHDFFINGEYISMA